MLFYKTKMFQPRNVFSLIHIFALFGFAICDYVSNIQYYTVNDTEVLTKIIYFNEQLYVGGRNVLLNLDPDLILYEKTQIGPVNDSQECVAEPEPCNYERVPTANDVKVLLPYAKHILVCGSVNQGICEIRRGDNISSSSLRVGHPGNVTNFVGGRSTVVAFFNGNKLYTASSYDGRPLNLSGYFASARIITQNTTVQSIASYALAYAYSDDVTVTGVDYQDDLIKQQYKSYYIYGFSHENYNYFVSYEPISLKRTDFETRIIRVCNDDDSFTSYSEIGLKCYSRTTGSNYNMATAAFFTNVSGSQRNKKRETEEGDWSLFITFARGNDQTIPQDENGTVMCRYSITKVIKAFEDETKNCFRGDQNSFKIAKIHGMEAKCQIKNDIDYCNIGAVNANIEGSADITGSFEASYKGIVTSLFVTEQNAIPVAFFGTKTGHVVKLNIKPNVGLVLYDIPVSTNGILPSNAVDETLQDLYLLSGNQIVKFPIGSCSLYKTCTECLANYPDTEPLKCGWCDGRCAHQNECDSRIETTSCPPYIHSISPLTGPVMGNTTISIKGENFGHSSDGKNEQNRQLKVTLGGSVCAVVSWEDHLIQCKTDTQTATDSFPITVDVNVVGGDNGIDKIGTATSTQTFSFVKPVFYGIYPNFGPIAGGTNVTAFGENLDIGSNRMLKLANAECVIISTTSNEVQCTSKNISYQGKEVIKGSLDFTIDGHHLKSEYSVYNQRFPQKPHVHSYFDYIINPQITNIRPRTTIQSGGTNLRVIGNNLHTIVNPRLVVRIVDTRAAVPVAHEIIKECVHQNIRHQKGTVMTCQTPPLEGIPTKTLPTAKVPTEAIISFIMDGVEDLRNFTQTHRNLSSLLYYPDPKYATFKDKIWKVPIDKPLILIKGENLNLAHTKDDINITLKGSIKCDVEYLSFSSLVCRIPKANVPTNLHNQSLQLVEVKAGSLNFTLGYVRFVEPLPSLGTGEIVGIVIACLIILILILGVIYKFGYLRKYKRPNNFAVSYVQDPEARRSNEYTDAHRNLTNGTPSSESQTSVANGAMGGACAAGASNSSLGDKRIPEETVRLLEADGILYPRNYLTVREIIGQGHFGRVYRGDLTLPDKESRDVAVKTLNNSRYRDAEDCEQFLQEGLMMKDFHHHHVLTLIGVAIDDDGFPMVIIPYMANGDLLSFVRNENNYPTVKDLLTYGIHIAEGMKYLSDLKFLHRDLAARNCMLDEDMVVKVADFGLSRDIYERDYYSSDNKKSKLPVKWMAPESLEKGSYSTKSDVWAFGVVLWELLTRGVTPYPEVDNWEILQYVKSGRRMPQPSYCPDLLYNLMLRCWSEDPKHRPSFGDLAEEIKVIIKKMEAKSKHQRVGTKVSYVNYPVDDPNARYANSSAEELS